MAEATQRGYLEKIRFIKVKSDNTNLISFKLSKLFGVYLTERPVRALRFRGPFGVWSWPILNILFEFISRFQGSAGHVGRAVENIEVWEWTDYRGQKRSLTVHRRVES